MRIMINEIELFKSVFKNINLLSDGVDFVFDNKGLAIGMLDKSHTIYYSCIFDKTFFTEYEYDDNNQGLYSLDATEFNKILKKCKGDELVITFTDECIIRNGSKTFTLRLLDELTNYNPSPPNIPYVYGVDVPIKFLKESLKDCEMFDQDVWFMTKGNKLVLSGDGMLGKYSNEYISDKELETTNSKFSIEKLSILLGADKISDETVIRGGNDMPLILETINPSEDVKLTGLIAPKIEVDDE